MATITLKVGDRTIELTTEEAKDAHQQLRQIFEGDAIREQERHHRELLDKISRPMPGTPANPNPYERPRFGDPPGWQNPNRRFTMDVQGS